MKIHYTTTFILQNHHRTTYFEIKLPLKHKIEMFLIFRFNSTLSGDYNSESICVNQLLGHSNT